MCFNIKTQFVKCPSNIVIHKVTYSSNLNFTFHFSSYLNKEYPQSGWSLGGKKSILWVRLIRFEPYDQKNIKKHNH
jgi:hypothetical protein